MKTTLRIAICLFAVAVFMASCTVEKRHYNSGYYVNWKHSKNTVKLHKAKAQVEPVAAVKELENVNMQQKVETVNTVPTENKQQPVTTSYSASASENVILSRSEAANEIKKHEPSQKMTVGKFFKAVKAAKELKKQMRDNHGSNGAPMWLIYLLCVFIPFVAVGIVTDWNLTKVLIAILLTILFWIPGIIYAFIVVGQET